MARSRKAVRMILRAYEDGELTLDSATEALMNWADDLLVRALQDQAEQVCPQCQTLLRLMGVEGR